MCDEGLNSSLAVLFVAAVCSTADSMIARRHWAAAFAAVPRRSSPRTCFSTEPSCTTSDSEQSLQHLEEEYATLKVNWFPGHMVKATKVIREKLKQVDMVFEVRDARIPFTSANADLDRIVGPNKERLVVLNKVDLANPALEQRVLQRFREEGKTAVFACGRTGVNVKKLLAWARERGAKRGEFSTTGAVVMVVGMPNVGKSSLINLLRDKASRERWGGGGGGGEGAKQVARVGATPGVTRQVSAFRIGSNPPLYLVDTPGVMIPRVEKATEGLRLALVRAVPDSTVPPDVTLGFMLRMVKLRRLFGSQQKKKKSANPRRALLTRHEEEGEIVVKDAFVTRGGSAGGGREKTQQQQESLLPSSRGSRAIEAWLLHATTSEPHHARRLDSTSHDDDTGACERDNAKIWEDDMEALLEEVERESGAEGKPDAESRRICCQYLLDAFREGRFGRITLDFVPRIRQNSESVSDPLEGGGWASGLKRRPELEQDAGHGTGDKGASALERRGRDLSAILDRDWSSASAWERAGEGRT